MRILPAFYDLRRGRWRSISAALACGYVLLLFPPWEFALPGAGLDASWVEVIGHAARHGWQWGRDVVFTYGPLGYLLPNPYLEGHVGVALTLNAFLTLSLALGIVAVLPRRAPLASLCLFALIVFPAGMMGRAALTLAGLLAALLYFQTPGLPAPAPVVLASAAGLFALVYVSSGVLGLTMFLLLDFSRLTHRRRPIFVPVFATTCLLAYLMGGQEVSQLPQFLRGSIELISGYGGAMSAVGNRLELAAFVPLSAAALGGVAWCERTAIRQPKSRWDALLLLAALGVQTFVAFKSGFVRHDLHSVNAWQALAVMLAGYAASRWHAPDASRVRWLLAAFSFAACTVSIFAAEQGVEISAVARYASRILIRQPALALRDAADGTINPAAWNAGWLERRTHALAAIRAAAALPEADGAVDVIPNIQSAVVAQGLLYRPRPVFQDYAAYTPWLVEKNRMHYRGAGAASYLFFGPETVDNRYPLLNQGAAVQELLSYYDPVQVQGDLLVLKRRVQPAQATLTNAQESHASLGQWVALEAVSSPVLLSVALSPSLIGRLGGFLYRPPILILTVRLANGSERVFRIVAGIASSGFLLSPLVESARDFAAVATDTWAEIADRRIVGFRIDTLSESARRFYREPIAYRSTEWHLDPAERRVMPAAAR